jgi:hypothetical protein
MPPKPYKSIGDRSMDTSSNLPEEPQRLGEIATAQRVKCERCRAKWIDAGTSWCESCAKAVTAELRARDRTYAKDLRAFAKDRPEHAAGAKAQAGLIASEWKHYDEHGSWPTTPLHATGFQPAAFAAWQKARGAVLTPVAAPDGRGAAGGG